MTTMRFALLTGLLVAGGGAAYGMLQVPRLQDPPKAKVDRLTDADSDLLPVKPKGAGADDLLPVEPKGAGKDDLLPVKSKGTPKDELLDPFADDNKPDAAERRRRLGSKAGKHPAPGINTNFSFDMVLGYQALVPGTGMVQSYYLLNSRQGHIGMDRGAIESMAQASAASDEASLDFQVITNTGNLYAYTTSSEMGRVAMTLHKEGGGLGRDFDALEGGDWFETTFKPTGKVRDIGRGLSNKPYRSVEYAGVDPNSGKPLKVWLANPDFEVDFYSVSYMGVGIVPLPKAGVQKLVTRMEGDRATFELSYVMRKQQTFSGAGYKDMSALMGAYGRGAPGGF